MADIRPTPGELPLTGDFGVRRVLEHFEAALDPIDRSGRFLKPSRRLRQVLGLEANAQVPALSELPAMTGHRELIATALRTGSDLQIQGAVPARDGLPPLSIRLFNAPEGTSRRWVILTPSGPDQPLAVSGMESLGLLMMHEVNNVLTTLGGFADYHLSVDDLPEDLKLSLEDASRLAKRSAGIMGFLRGLSGKSQLDEPSSPEDPNAPMREIVELAGWLVGNRHKVEVRLGADPAPMPLQHGLIRLAVLNLLLNALKALGSLPGVITLTSRDEKGAVHLAIGDSGPGVAPELKDRLFNPGATDGNGLGLGLALVKEVALRHGGTVDVADQDDGGVVISMVIPR